MIYVKSRGESHFQNYQEQKAQLPLIIRKMMSLSNIFFI